MMKSILFLTLCSLCLLTVPSPAAAKQTGRCHCFRDRVYDPARKFAADDYLLATSFNSLIAATLGISKRQLVMMKMKGGVDPDNLLIALYIANRTKTQLDLLLSIRDNGGSWQSIVNSPALQGKYGTDPVLIALAGGTADHEIGSRVADAMISSHYHARPEKIAELRRQDFSSKEIGLIFALHRLKAVPLEEIVAMSRQKKMSWSEIAHSFQLTPSALGKIISGAQG
jgi:hypothetical protein